MCDQAQQQQEEAEITPSFLTAEDFKSVAAVSTKSWRAAGALAEINGGFEVRIQGESWTFVPTEYEDRVFAADRK